jgi:hypothetical protein
MWTASAATQALRSCQDAAVFETEYVAGQVRELLFVGGSTRAAISSDRTTASSRRIAAEVSPDVSERLSTTAPRLPVLMPGRTHCIPLSRVRVWERNGSGGPLSGQPDTAAGRHVLVSTSGDAS